MNNNILCCLCEHNIIDNMNEICKECLESYGIVDANNNKIQIKLVNGYVCYYSNNIAIPRCTIFVNNNKCAPYLINDQIIIIR